MLVVELVGATEALTEPDPTADELPPLEGMSGPEEAGVGELRGEVASPVAPVPVPVPVPVPAGTAVAVTVAVAVSETLAPVSEAEPVLTAVVVPAAVVETLVAAEMVVEAPFTGGMVTGWPTSEQMETTMLETAGTVS